VSARSELSCAFQRLCHRFFRGVFYQQGNFAAFGAEDQDRFLAELREACDADFADRVEGAIELLRHRGLSGMSPVDMSKRQEEINRFRLLLGALFFSHELDALEAMSEQELVDSWFAPPPYWLLRYYETVPKLQKHLRRINPELARRAGRAPATAATFEFGDFASMVERELGPHLTRRHYLFWRDDKSKAKLDPRGGKKPSLKECHDALTFKLDDIAAACDEEIAKLTAELREPVPRGVNSLIFHFLAWIAWSEPPLSPDPQNPEVLIPNPGFEPMKHFIEQLASQEARRTCRIWQSQGYAPKSEEDLKHDLVVKALIMFRNDQLRSAINLNAKIRSTLKREAQQISLAERQTNSGRVDIQDQGHFDRLTHGRGEHSLGDRLAQSLTTAEDHAQFSQFVENRWEALRTRVADHLDELDPSRVRLPTELRDRVARHRPELLLILPELEPPALMRWYYLEALGYSADELARELNFQKHAISPAQQGVWLDHLSQDTPIDTHNQLLDAALELAIHQWLESGDMTLE
jgi:hypothetical protein